ncbi:hypothetical protein JM946_00275 [Steroidobacter sp. S1-65]|uniref:Glycerophosphoryl diester phosphodiesterase membrane domain-containing protein n=1 Tax=Steroidobacter gossypii TaxID=2805490 RepID=A0ABS1WQA9_9GAMM|nr:hypothetical protein [Steroidobacter gossypii]MBM0103154.1 hypothetical protein [Steroidobacter gossypii]
MAIQPTQPQGVGGVLDTAFQLYKASFGAVWPISLLLAVVNGVPAVIMAFTLADLDPSTLATNPFAMYNDPMTVIITLVAGVLALWIGSALFIKQRAVGIAEQMSTGEALGAALPRLLPMFIAGILFAIAIAIGIILLVIPGLILMVSLFLYMTLLLFENKGPIDSLIGSHKLVWGNWWRSCAVMTLMAILLFVILLAVGLVIGVIMPFAGLALGDAIALSMLMQGVSNALFYMFLGPFATAVLISLYWDLKLRKQGGDLAARVNALSAA